jgi:Transposase DDE domain
VRAVEIIQRQFQVDLAGVHLARVRVVFAAVFTALRCGHVSLTALGRAIAERTTHKHGIKRIDRLLGNERVHSDRVVFYRALARRVISAERRPVIIIDWTGVTSDLWALAAAVSFHGRAITIYAEAHPISRYLKPQVNAAFIEQLAAILPYGAVPIILADAGFRTPFMNLVQSRGWDYVVRVRGPHTRIRWNDRREMTLRAVFELTTTRPRDLGRVEVSAGRHATRIVGVRRPVGHRKHRTRRPFDTIPRRERRAAHEPWILATSLEIESARVVALYARRMQIEETFRDAKNPRFGLSLAHARTKCNRRADVLLLLASLAHLIAILLGIGVETAGLQRGYQANTVVRKRTLSLATLGRFLVRSANRALLGAALDKAAWAKLRMRVAEGQSF